MTARGTQSHWCWSGLIAAASLGLLLSEARDLFSMTERLASIDLGLWMPLSEVGLQDVHWSFRITPWAAWWGIACGGLACLIGWQAAASEESMPFGIFGGLSWLSMGIVLFADNLLVATLGWCGQSLILGVWLGWQARTQPAVAGVRQYLVALLVSDTLWLMGVLLVGLSWRSFEFTSLELAEFVQEGWRTRPALCGFAASCLCLGLLGRAWLFPFAAGLRGVTAFSGPANAWVFGVCGGPITWWLFLRAWPLMSVSQETVALMQGLALLGSAVGAFLAMGQTDPRRATGWLMSAQLGVLISAAIVPGLVDRHVFAWGAWASTVATVMLFLSVKTDLAREAPPLLNHRFSAAMALLIVAGACPAPAFWIMSASLEAGAESISMANESREKIDADSEALPGADSPDHASISTPPQPMPIRTWCAAWCLWSFCSAFAAWRVWRWSGPAESALTNSASVGLTIGMLACCAGTAVWVWRRTEDWSAMTPGPSWWGIAASSAGWLLSAWICRDPRLADERFQQLGSWTRLSRRELYLDEVRRHGIELPIRVLGQLVRAVDGLVIDGMGKRIGQGAVQGVVNSVEELRNQPASFYAGALLLTIGSLLLTWLSLTS